jgi:hypothetical protein
VAVEGGGLVARQTGKYPATDGTSIWSDVALPPTGEHYWECVFHCPPPDAGQPAASKGSALRGGFLIGVAKSTVTELDEDDEPVEVDRDCGREQYIFRLPGQWGLEDSASTNGGPLRGGKDGGEPTGGSEVGSSLKKADPKHFGGGFTNPEIKSPSWPMPPR